MGDLTLQLVMLRICAGLLIVSVHGAVLSATAWILGDKGPNDDGRLGLNPLRHVDLLGSLLLVLFAYGWIRPMSIDPGKLRGGRPALAASAVGALCVTIAVAELLLLLRPFMLNIVPDMAAETFFILVEINANLSISFALLNVLPLPPLTGQQLLAAAFPRQQDRIRRTQPYFAAAFLLFIISGAAAWLFGPAELLIHRVILGR